ncbi:MAG: hypothetical protein K8R41_03860, partial [Bacteroidales bacterium]|nr:hypothetical protein [Bacteroidales bacterium]
TLFNKSYAQKTNPAIIENVSRNYAWDIVYQGFKKHNKKLNKYNKQTQTAKSGLYRYTSMLVDNRAKYQVTYKNGNIEIKFVNRQYLSKQGWVNNLLPLSKKTKKKYIYPIATTIRELNEVKKLEEINLYKTPPLAVFSTTPTSGSTSIFIKFDGSDSYDNETLTPDLKIRWDWENDGKWDKTWSTEKHAKHKFLSNGISTIKMEVMDTDGSTHDTTMQVLIENFTPCPDITSIEYLEETYNTVLIGEQCWMRENLNAGEMIIGFDNMKNNGTIEKYCYNNDPINCKKFGGLYQWDELMQYTPKDSTGICPEGWHIPTKNDFDELIKYLGGKNISGEKLKEAGSIYWLSPETSTTNNSGFAALPAGIGGGDNSFNEIEIAAYFATTKHKRSLEEFTAEIVNPYSNEPIENSFTKDTSYNIVLSKNSIHTTFDKHPSYKGVSVRCIKNDADEPQNPIAKFHYYHPFPKPLKKPTYRLFKFNPFKSYDNQDPDSELLVSWNWDWKNNKDNYSEFRKMKIIEKLLEQDRTYIVKLIVMDTDGNRDTTSHRVKVAKNTPPRGVISFRKWDCGDTSTWFPFKAMYSRDKEYYWELLTYCWNYDVHNIAGGSDNNIYDSVIYLTDSLNYLTDSIINFNKSAIYKINNEICYIPKGKIYHDNSGLTKDRTWGSPPYMWSTRHKYSKSGIYTVKLTVTDPEGLSDVRYAKAKVCDPKSPPPKNKPPKACFTVYPKKGTTCDVFKFDASCSSDFEDPIDSLKFCWFFDWGKHRKYPDLYWSKKNKIVKHKYSITDDLGYVIRLGVMDTKGKKHFFIRKYLKVSECIDTFADLPSGTKKPGTSGESGTEKPGKTEKPATEKPEKIKDLPYTPKGTGYTPPTTNCPKKEYEFYFPFDQEDFTDSLDRYADKGYKLVLGSFVTCFFEREVNSKTIYPIKVLKKTNIEELNNLAEQNWVVVNALFLTYLIQDKNAPLYKYKYCDDISNSNLRK